MQDLIILGTGIHGAEMAHIVERINRIAPTWNLIGHIAPKPGITGEWFGRPVLGTVEKLADFPNARLIADNEFPKPTPIPVERLITLIDPSCYVHPSATLGPGCVLYPNCFVGARAKFGERCFALAGAVINHDDVIEDRSVLCTNVSLAGGVHVESNCYLGQACTVRQFLRIGQGSLVGMGSVVVKDVPPRVVVAGNPAVKMRDRK